MIDYGPGFLNVTISNSLIAFSDADWVGDVDTNRTTTEYIVHLGMYLLHGSLACSLL